VLLSGGWLTVTQSQGTFGSEGTELSFRKGAFCKEGGSEGGRSEKLSSYFLKSNK